MCRPKKIVDQSPLPHTSELISQIVVWRKIEIVRNNNVCAAVAVVTNPGDKNPDWRLVIQWKSR